MNNRTYAIIGEAAVIGFIATAMWAVLVVLYLRSRRPGRIVVVIDKTAETADDEEDTDG